MVQGKSKSTLLAVPLMFSLSLVILLSPASAIMPPDPGFPRVCSVISVCKSDQECLRTPIPIRSIQLNETASGYVIQDVVGRTIPLGYFPTVADATAYLKREHEDREFGIVLVPDNYVTDSIGHKFYSVDQRRNTFLSETYMRLTCNSKARYETFSTPAIRP